MRYLAMFFTLIAFTATAQFTTSNLKNTDPLSKISKVEFDSTTKILTVFDNKDNWNFEPISTNRIKDGFEITARSKTEKIYYILRLKGESIVYFVAYDDKRMNLGFGFK